MNENSGLAGQNQVKKTKTKTKDPSLCCTGAKIILAYFPAAKKKKQNFPQAVGCHVKTCQSDSES